MNNDDNPRYSAEDSHDDSDGEDMWHNVGIHTILPLFTLKCAV